MKRFMLHVSVLMMFSGTTHRPESQLHFDLLPPVFRHFPPWIWGKLCRLILGINSNLLQLSRIMNKVMHTRTITADTANYIHIQTLSRVKV